MSFSTGRSFVPNMHTHTHTNRQLLYYLSSHNQILGYSIEQSGNHFKWQDALATSGLERKEVWDKFKVWRFRKCFVCLLKCQNCHSCIHWAFSMRVWALKFYLFDSLLRGFGETCKGALRKDLKIIAIDICLSNIPYALAGTYVNAYIRLVLKA